MRDEELFRTRQALDVLEVLKKMGCVNYVSIYSHYQTREAAKGLIKTLLERGIATIQHDHPDILFYNPSHTMTFRRPVTDSFLMREKVIVALRSLQGAWENTIPQEELYRELLQKGMSLDDIRDWRLKLMDEKIILVNEKGSIVIVKEDLKVAIPPPEDVEHMSVQDILENEEENEDGAES